MHHVTVPAHPQATLPSNRDPYDGVEQWLLRQMDAWSAQGLDLGRIVFDPGIGFGKSRLQSLRLLRRAGEFRRHGLRVLVGHSRKSFMRGLRGQGRGGPRSRDARRLPSPVRPGRGTSSGSHNVPLHVTAYRGWSAPRGLTPTPHPTIRGSRRTTGPHALRYRRIDTARGDCADRLRRGALAFPGEGRAGTPARLPTRATMRAGPEGASVEMNSAARRRRHAAFRYGRLVMWLVSGRPAPRIRELRGASRSDLRGTCRSTPRSTASGSTLGG